MSVGAFGRVEISLDAIGRVENKCLHLHLDRLRLSLGHVGRVENGRVENKCLDLHLVRLRLSLGHLGRVENGPGVRSRRTSYKQLDEL